MADRLPSDHDAVETRRATVSRVGGTNRPRLELPTHLSVAPGDVVRLVLDGTEYHARVESSLDGTLVVDRAADNARLARTREGENRLAEWVAEAQIGVGDAVHFDVVTPGFKYGVRTPGNRVVYVATDAPADSLADIARDLDG